MKAIYEVEIKTINGREITPELLQTMPKLEQTAKESLQKVGDNLILFFRHMKINTEIKVSFA